MSSSFSAYSEPSFKSKKVADFSPQTVVIHAVTENGWGLIDTFKGKNWIYIGAENNKNNSR